MPDRRIVIAGNWKMHKTATETKGLVTEIRNNQRSTEMRCDVVVAPPFTSIAAAVEAASGSNIAVSGQNLHWKHEGAFTGEVSALMLRDAGCSYVIIGHSERRQYFGERDETINLKVIAAMKAGLIPILCIGETLEEREYGSTFDVIDRQLANALVNIEINEPERFILAYEPVWAIGTGKTATPEQAQEVHSYLRKELTLFHGENIANAIRILYGGSLKPENALELLSQTDIDGGLIGGASLKSTDFLAIINKASEI